MRNYVFMSASIFLVGGMQAYVSEKKKYLEKQGWRVLVFFPELSNNKTKYHNLEDCAENKIWQLGYPPIYFNGTIRNNIVNKIIHKLDDKCGEIVIESHNDTLALWGEIVAKKVNGKNFAFILNEQFRGKAKYYLENIDFFKFKLKRRELAVISQHSLENLFEGMDYSKPSFNCVLSAANNNSVSDYYEEKVDIVEKKDINIGYLGRLDKGYLKRIIEEIIKFAEKHCEKEIQFLIIGNGNQEQVNKFLDKKPPNLFPVMLGEFVPIPKSIFKKVDVMIAGSGCAIISTREGVKTIVPDAKTYEAIGILGYTTNSFIYDDGVIYSYAELLEDILVRKKYDLEPCNFKEIGTPESAYKEHFKFIKMSESSKEYFYGKSYKNYAEMNAKEIMKITFCNIIGNIVFDKIYLKMKDNIRMKNSK